MPVQAKRTIEPGYEPIAGYVLEEKIGEGGFGEVWRANAQGGLKKAVKLVHGATDEKRGSRELKSLERIKGVHHPFLLTLERFGIVDDRLVIVTELADGSLEDVCKRHQERGSCGIPRQALLSYLHDAADALDYLHQEFQLQHLDIKPGNLLLLSGHAKVADFGLLKDLREVEQSIVGGLTPIYAAPEVFDGQPSINSDQYSLAIMYQELLTGTRPFDGRTIAQLATQHVHSAPNLKPLPPADRAAVAQALEKDPQQRFGSCKEFLEALRTAEQSASQVASIARNADADDEVDATVEDLPDLAIQSDRIHTRTTGHALVIAIGGRGASVLRELRDRVAALHTACPLDLHSVLIDTNNESIHAARLLETSDRIPPATLIHTPLRSAQDYRAAGHANFRSVSRRWIYNVPRSGATEGMRPLGRLAMLDHATTIDEKMRQAIDHLAAVCGQRTPRVYVVSSVSGGTGSGMVMDLVPRVRQLLDEAGLQSSEVMPLLMCAPFRGNPHQPIMLHDTRAAIMELSHYTQVGGSYPGESSSKWPVLPAARNPLSDAYLIADSESDSAGSASALDTIVDYLWADATGASELLALARKQEPSLATRLGPTLRSVGVVRLRGVRTLEEDLLGPAAVRQLFARWLGLPAESEQLAGPLAERLRKRCGLDRDTFQNDFWNWFGGRNHDGTVSERVQRIVSSTVDAVGNPVDKLDDALKQYLNQGDVSARVEQLSATVVVSISRELAARLQDGRIDLTTGMFALDRLVGLCTRYAKGLEQNIERVDRVDSQSVEDTDDVQARVSWYLNIASLRLVALASRIAADAYHDLGKQLEEVKEKLRCGAVQVADAIQRLPGSMDEMESTWREMPPAVAMQLEKLLGELHRQAADTWLTPRLTGGTVPKDARRMAEDLIGRCLPLVEKVVDEYRNPHSGRTESLVDDTQSTPDVVSQTQTSLADGRNTVGITQTMSSGNHLMTQTHVNVDPAKRNTPEALTMEEAIQAVNPELLKAGGRQRLLLLAPTDTELKNLSERLDEHLAGQYTRVVVPGIAPCLIREAQAIPVEATLKRLDLVSGGNAEISSRLHSRNDVDWQYPGRERFDDSQ
ncbi:MAG: protein kinase [Planctomycetota bacterium]